MNLFAEAYVKILMRLFVSFLLSGLVQVATSIMCDLLHIGQSSGMYIVFGPTKSSSTSACTLRAVLGHVKIRERIT